MTWGTEIALVTLPKLDGDTVSAHVNGRYSSATCSLLGDEIHLFNQIDGHSIVTITKPSYLSSGASTSNSNTLIAPMNGKVEKVNVAAGDSVTKDQPLVIMEAMKMELVLRAPRDGKVVKVPFAAGALVTENAVVVEVLLSP